MKKLEKKALLRAGLALVLAFGTMFSAGAEAKKIAATPNVDVYIPEGATGKLPVVFLAHNGGGTTREPSPTRAISSPRSAGPTSTTTKTLRTRLRRS